jgi:hypothetical protein
MARATYALTLPTIFYERSDACEKFSISLDHLPIDRYPDRSWFPNICDVSRVKESDSFIL